MNSESLVLACRRCGVELAPRVSWQNCVGGKRHLRANCAVCGGWIKFLAQTPENIALVRDEPQEPVAPDAA